MLGTYWLLHGAPWSRNPAVRNVKVASGPRPLPSNVSREPWMCSAVRNDTSSAAASFNNWMQSSSVSSTSSSAAIRNTSWRKAPLQYSGGLWRILPDSTSATRSSTLSATSRATAGLSWTELVSVARPGSPKAKLNCCPVSGSVIECMGGLDLGPYEGRQARYLIRWARTTSFARPASPTAYRNPWSCVPPPCRNPPIPANLTSPAEADPAQCPQEALPPAVSPPASP